MNNKSNKESIGERVLTMLKDCKKWKPETKQEKRDKAVVVQTLKYAVSGIIKPMRSKQ